MFFLLNAESLTLQWYHGDSIVIPFVPQAVDALGAVPVLSTEVVIKKKTPFFDLKVNTIRKHFGKTSSLTFGYVLFRAISEP